jgi:amino acid transporter
MANLLATKPLDMLMREAGEQNEHSLKRALGPVNLVTLGIGAIIGAGIFVLTGAAASLYAGPAIVLSYILAGVGCAFAGLCYAEFASLIPIAGSAYTYGYATLGEIFAWIIGWDLILEYAFGAATVPRAGRVPSSSFFRILVSTCHLNSLLHPSCKVPTATSSGTFCTSSAGAGSQAERRTLQECRLRRSQPYLMKLRLLIWLLLLGSV